MRPLRRKYASLQDHHRADLHATPANGLHEVEPFFELADFEREAGTGEGYGMNDLTAAVDDTQ